MTPPASPLTLDLYRESRPLVLFVDPIRYKALLQTHTSAGIAEDHHRYYWLFKHDAGVVERLELGFRDGIKSIYHAQTLRPTRADHTRITVAELHDHLTQRLLTHTAVFDAFGTYQHSIVTDPTLDYAER